MLCLNNMAQCLLGAIASCSFWQKIACNTTKSMMEIELLVIVDMLKVFKGMLWGHMIKVYFLIKTGSKMPLVWSLTISNSRAYYLRSIVPTLCTSKTYILLLLIPFLDLTQVQSNDKANWMSFTKCWYYIHAGSTESTYDHKEQINTMFENSFKKDVI